MQMSLLKRTSYEGVPDTAKKSTLDQFIMTIR